MSTFGYFVPGCTNADAAIEAAGLRRVFEGVPVAMQRVAGGPGGGAGVILSPDENGVLFEPERQTWENCGRYWLGWLTGNPPGPADLARPDPVDGVTLTLPDGRQWLCPEWRLVPVAYSQFDESGPIKRTVAAQYRKLQPIVDRVIAGTDGAAVDDRDYLIAAVAALNVNYRIGLVEASALEILTTSSVRDILRVLIGAYAQKKT